MKRKLSCKSGSTMVMLVMAIGIISLLGTSILGITMMNYKIKRANTELKSSFYMSETGLDKAYERAYQLMLEAVNEGNKEAQNFMNEITLEIAEINKSEYDSPPVVDVAYGDYIEITAVKPYIAVPVKDNIKAEQKEKFNQQFEMHLNSKIDNNLKSSIKPYDDDKLQVDVISSRWDASEEDTNVRELTVKIKSTYNTDYLRKTSADLIIKIPEYSEPYEIETKTIPVHKLWMYGIVANNIKAVGNLSPFQDDAVNINGDVYIAKNLEIEGNNTGINFKKTLTAVGGYGDDDGILIKGTDSKLKVNNVFTKNIILSGAGASFVTDTVGEYEIYVKDDLEMNSIRQKVDIKGSYYGFSSGGERFTPNTLNSALIINSSDIDTIGSGSSLNISKDLVLYGTSYIKGTDYATGESVSIPGNYIAYTRPLTGGSSDGNSLASNNIETIFYDPLPPLAYKFNSGGVLWVWNKADYFSRYYEEKGSTDIEFGNNNINIGGNIRTLGLSISNDNLVSSSYSDSSFRNEILQDEDTNIYKSAYKKATKDYYSGLEDKISKNTLTAKPGQEILYVGNENITIDNGECKGDVRTRGIIVTTGNVTITGEFNFRGTIIAGGNITINHIQGKKVNIVHDKNYIAKTISENNKLTELFEDGDAGIFTVTSYKNSASNVVDFKDYINFKNWKME